MHKGMNGITTTKPNEVFDFTFVFPDINAEYASKFDSFWEEHEKYFLEEMNSYGTAINYESLSTISTEQSKRDSSLMPAALALSRSGEIIGVAFVKLVKMDVSLLFGSHAYHQIMYIRKEKRKAQFFRLAYPLYKAFFNGFTSESCPRDSRARYLIAENINPSMRKPSMRYAKSLGFRLLGKHSLGSETWILPLLPPGCKQKG